MEMKNDARLTFLNQPTSLVSFDVKRQKILSINTHHETKR